MGCVEATGLWQQIAQINKITEGVIKEIGYLVRLVNEKQAVEDELRATIQILRDIEETGFTFSTEMDLEHVIERLERRTAKTA